MITQNRVVVTVCFLVILLGELAAAANNPLLRQTKFGSVEGYDDNERGVWGWRGIPFAKPPVGNLRWRKPEDPEPWKGIRPAKKYSPACIQPSIEPPLTILPQATGSEDCLYLNVYRPQTAEENLPVYFWIHGGGNIFGSAEGCSEGCCVEDLARNANMVVVVVQYRLGVLGFFTHPALRSGASGADDSGNFGMLDQIKALQWVRNNITAFGGNPYNVTIAGHSAGGYAVGELTISPLARGLFHRAVNQSGGWLSQSIASIDETANCTIENALIMKDLAKDLKDARRIRREMTDFELASFLRDMPASELVSAHFRGGSPAKPVWAFAIEDGLVIPGPVFQVVESGRYSRVPTIMGVTRTESGFDNITVPSLYPGMPDYRDLIQVVEGKRKLEEVLPTPRD